VRKAKTRIGRPPLARDSKHYTFRLPASVMARVDRFAKGRGLTRSEALRDLLLQSLGEVRQ